MTLFALITASVRGQIIAGFDCHSPNAWFDKDIYFVAFNNAQTFNQWGYVVPQSFGNVYACVNRETWYKISDVWYYNTYVTLENAKLDMGSTVEIYSNGYCIGSWVCNVKQPTFKDNVLRAYKNRPYTRPNPKGIQKFFRILEKDLPMILKRIK